MTISWKLLLVFFLLAVGIGVAGFLYLENQQAFIKRHQEEELAAIADLKVGQIVNWRQERISDAEAITQNPLLARTVQQWRTEPDAAWLKPELLGWLTALRQAYGYRNAFLLDTEGALLLASPERDGPFDPNRIHLALQAARTQQTLLSDLHSDAGATNAHLDLVAPLLSVQGGESVPVAVVLLEIAPDDFLYPMIQSWPTPSESVETLLVERDGDDVLYLNDLRFRKNAALALRLPLSTERLPAAAAVRGYEGILAGIDYRGVPVWAAARAIPNSPWSLVAKIDAAEITTPMEASARSVLVLIGVFVLVAAGVTALIARNQQLGFYRKQYEAERQGRNLALQLDHLSRYANDIVLLVDDQYHIVQANERAVAAYGYPREQLLRMNARDLRAPQAREAFDENAKRVTEYEGLVYETLNIRRDGTIFPVEASTRLIELEGKKYYQAIIRDITERKRAEQALRASEERYRTLAEAAHDHIYVINRDGTVEYVNRFGANLFRARPEDLVHKPLSAVFPSEVAEAYKAALTLVFESEEPLYAEGITEFPSGRLWLSTWLVPLKDAAGHARAVLGISRDITERKQVEEQAQRRAEQLALLYDAGLTLNRVLDPHVQLEFLFQIAMKALHADRAQFFGFDEDRNELRYEFGVGHTENIESRLRDLVRRMDDEQSIVAHVARNRLPLNLPDVSADPSWIVFDPKVRSGLWVPVQHEGRLRGVLNVLSTRLNAFTPHDERLLALFSNEASVAMENARLFADLRQRVTELEAVHEISSALRSAQTLDEMLPRLLDKTLAVLETEAGILFHYDVESDTLKKALARGWFTRIPDSLMTGKEGMVARVLETGQVYASEEFVADPRLRASIRPFIPAAWGGVCVPIRTIEAVVGILFVAFKLPRRLEPDEVRLLTTVAEIAGNAIHRMRLHEQTERRLEQIQALRNIDTAITASLDLRVMLNVVLEQITAQLRVDAAAVLLLNPHTQILEYTAGRGFRSPAIERSRLRLGEGYAGQAALDRDLKIVSNISPGEGYARAQLLAGEGFVTYLAVPLVAKGRVKGVLELFHRAALKPDAEWLGFLKSLALQAAIAIDNAGLFDALQRSNVELGLAYESTLEGWSRALDMRDKETEGHTQRVTEMTVRVAAAMGIHDAEMAQVRRGALLHDIGKMGVPDSILLKREPLTEDEWIIMRRHPDFAYELLAPIAHLRPALDIPYCHHENWDGSGYPRGLKGEQIPLAARIFAVVDAWDALLSERPYRAAWSEENVREYLRAQAGQRFDPNVVEVFLRMA